MLLKIDFLWCRIKKREDKIMKKYLKPRVDVLLCDKTDLLTVSGPDDDPFLKDHYELN